MIYLLLLVFASPFLYRFIYWFIDPIIQSYRDADALHYHHQLYNPITNTYSRFPQSLIETEEGSIDLSLIAPAYNEEERLIPMINDTLRYLKDRSRNNPLFSWELIIVDDGSKDNTTQTGLSFVKQEGIDRVRVLTLKENQGKGGAVQQGMLHARGRYLLMVDADGATQIDDLDRLEKELNNIIGRGGNSGDKEEKKETILRKKDGIVVGSRSHMEDAAVAKRRWYRNILMYGFHFAVWLLAVRGIKDTQCGFKLFTRNTARQLFINQRLRRWCFDVELLYIAQSLSIPIKEVAVNWQEIPGSKLSLMASSLLMARDLVIIRFCYTVHLWTIRDINTVVKNNKLKSS